MPAKKAICLLLLALTATAVQAQKNDTVVNGKLNTVQVKAAKRSGLSRLSGPENGMLIGQDELFRAACCNLGESFVTNPSVDINYNDAAVGAKQIKLLGLSGQYVQMLCENQPMSGGASHPYLLAYVPGAWMKSIAVSKGASSVKNGFQSVTGQIDVEYLKPEDPEGIQFNLYGDSHLKTEANLVANKYLGGYLCTEIMGHYEKDFAHHDDNHDGWLDAAAVEQLHLQNRWKYMKGHYIFHGGLGFLDDSREGGQAGWYGDSHKHASPSLAKATDSLYHLQVDARRYEGYMKHAFLLDHDHNTNIALLANAFHYDLDGIFGRKQYSYNQNALYSQLAFEHDFNDHHNLAAGLSFNMEQGTEQLWIGGIADNLAAGDPLAENTAGLYAQYTYKPSYKLTAMGGIRVDRSNLYGAFVTPRLHIKWNPTDWLNLRLSTGKGWRSPHPLAENHHLLASGRQITIAAPLSIEEAWNSGICASLFFPINEKLLKINIEYYYTHFNQQTVLDFDSDPSAILITNLNGSSYSHTAQIDATYNLFDNLTTTAAFRLNDVKCTYGNQLLEKPLTSRYKALFTATWKPRMELWNIDLTLQLNGPGRMPTPYTLADGTPSWNEEFEAFPQLNLQVTRTFKHFSVYVGGENLTNYRQQNPVINADNPWSDQFDPTLVYGPVLGIMAYAGIRMKF